MEPNIPLDIIFILYCSKLHIYDEYEVATEVAIHIYFVVSLDT